MKTTATKPKSLVRMAEQARLIANGATQFRVPVNPQPLGDNRLVRIAEDSNVWTQMTKQGHLGGYHPCPYPPGTVLAVKEPWQVTAHLDEKRETEFFHWPVRYGDGKIHMYGIHDGDAFGKVRPARSMPAWAVRTHLEVVSVREQRVQDISYNDCLAEGVYGREWADDHHAARHGQVIARFANLWDSINAKRPGCLWADNPWVWAVTHKRVEAPR